MSTPPTIRCRTRPPHLSGAPRTTLLALAALLVTVSGSGVAAITAGSQEVTPIRLPGTGLEIDRPAEWRVGGTVGHGVLVTLIGRNEGYPNFSVMTDPEFHEPGASVAELANYVENLHRELKASKRDLELDEEGWTEVNGIRVHSSLASWSTVTGRLRARRLIFTHAGRPYLLTWIERAEKFTEIAPLIDRCVASLRASVAPPARGVVGR